MRSSRTIAVGLCAAMLAATLAAASARAAGPAPWITSWAATPGPRWADELPAPFGVPETLENQTIRQVARLSVGGRRVRVVLSNAFGVRPLRIGAATVGLAGAGGAVDPASLRGLRWGGADQIVIPPGAPAISDPVDLSVAPLSLLSVSLFLPDKTGITSVHWDGVQTGYISGPGDQTRAAAPPTAGTTKSRLFLSGIMTDAAPAAQAVVFFGDSITDGFCSTVDANHRWPDRIAERLQSEGHGDVAVVNEAYSGDRVLSNGMGTNALSRFDMSVLSHPRASTVVMMMGINDIGWPGPGAFLPDAPEPTAAAIEAGYAQIVERAHLHGLRLVMATLTPFADTFAGTPTAGYYTPAKEAIRQQVNGWIRGNHAIDGVIDFDRLLRDQQRPDHIRHEDDCHDHLHPNDAGYRAMADSVDLAVLLGR